MCNVDFFSFFVNNLCKNLKITLHLNNKLFFTMKEQTKIQLKSNLSVKTVWTPYEQTET